METAAAYALERTRILIVEDEAIIAHDIQAILEDLGYAVPGTASSGPEALALADVQHYDLALMDIRIRGRADGIQVADELRKRHGLGVIYLTAHTDDDTLRRARETGPLGYLAKPFTASGLKVALVVALERQRLQLEVEDREAWLHSALRSTGDAIFLRDFNGCVSFVNAAAEALTGVSSSAACGRELDDVLRVHSEAGVVQRLQARLARSGEPQFLTGLLARPDGSECPVLISVAPFSTGTASGEGAVIVLRDISELRKKERELRDRADALARSNEELTLLSNSLSHDFKEPLRHVSAFSKLLMREQGNLPAEEATEYLGQIDAGCKRMAQLISSLTESVRNVALDRTSVALIDASGPFQDALLNLESAILSSNAQIEAMPLPSVFVNPTALTLIFQNLIENAITYRGPTTPRIEVSASRLDDCWQFTVADHGPGFDPQQADRIFNLDRRAHSGGPAGGGLGLPICKRLLEQYQGRIWAESVEGGGARFHFTLRGETEETS